MLECYKQIPLVFKHYLEFLKIEKQLLNCYKYKFHDLDKLFLLIFCPFLGIDFIEQLHQKKSKHHPIYKIGRIPYYKDMDDINWEETIINWHCKYVNSESSLSAKETFYQLYSIYDVEVETIFKTYKID